MDLVRHLLGAHRVALLQSAGAKGILWFASDLSRVIIFTWIAMADKPMGGMVGRSNPANRSVRIS